MSPLSNTLFFIINSLGNLFISAFLLRFLLQLVQADFYNPLSQLIVKVTQPFLIPFRYFIPSLGRCDIAACLLAIIFEMLLIYALGYLTTHGHLTLSLTTVLVIAIYRLLNLLLNIYLYSLIIVAIASWIAPLSHNPVLLLIMQLLHPITSRVRKFIPSIGGLDFSFMIIVFIIIAIQNFLPSLFY